MIGPKFNLKKYEPICYYSVNPKHEGHIVHSSGGSFGRAYGGHFGSSSSGSSSSSSSSRNHHHHHSDNGDDNKVPVSYTDDSGHTVKFYVDKETAKDPSKVKEIGQKMIREGHIQASSGDNGYHIGTWKDSEGKVHTVIKDSSNHIVAFTNPNDAHTVLEKFQSGKIQPKTVIYTKDESTGQWVSGSSSIGGISSQDVIYISRLTNSNSVDFDKTILVTDDGREISAAEWAKQNEPVKIGNLYIPLSNTDYQKVQKIKAKHPGAQIYLDSGKIKIKYTEKIEQPVNLNNLDVFFDTSGAKTVKPQKDVIYVAPKAEISNISGFEGTLEGGMVGNDQTVYDVLTKTVDVNIPNLETIKMAESIDIVNPIKESHYIGIDNFEWEEAIAQKQEKHKKILNEYLQTPARAKMTEYETKFLNVAGNVGHAIGGDGGEVVTKALAYDAIGATEITIGTGVAIGTALAEKSFKPIQGHANLLIEGGKETIISTGKILGYLPAKAVESITDIPAPTPNKDDIAITLSLVLPELAYKGVKTAKLKTININNPTTTSLDLGTKLQKLQKNEILEIGVSDGGKPYIVKTTERGRVVKRWIDIENVEVEQIKNVLVEKHPQPIDYTEQQTIFDNNKAYKREFNSKTGIYKETLVIKDDKTKRIKTASREVDLSKLIPDTKITMTAETTVRKQEMQIIRSRREMAQILSYEDALLGEKKIKSRYVSDEIIRLDERSKEDNFILPAPDISADVKPKPPADIKPPTDIKPPIVDTNPKEILDIKPPVEIFSKESSKGKRTGRIFTVEDILKKGEEKGGKAVKNSKGTLQLEKTKTEEKTKVKEKQKEEEILDLTDIELEDIKPKTVEKVKENVLDLTKIGEKVGEKGRIKTTELELIKPMELPKQKPKLKLKPLELIKEKPVEKTKIKTAEIPALKLKLRLSQAQAKTVSLPDTLLKTKTVPLTSSLTSLKTSPAPTLTVPVPALRVKYPKLKIGNSGGNRWRRAITKTEKKQTFKVINLANLKIDI